MNRILTPTLLALAFTAFGAAAGAAEFRNQTAVDVDIEVKNQADVVKGKLFVSPDQGKTWTKVAEADALPGRKLTLGWKAPADGTYLLKTAAVFVAGKGAPEPDPTPGVVPPTALTVVIDTTAPKVTAFTPAFVEKVRAEQLNLDASWTVEDANLGSAGVEVEFSLDEGKAWVQAAKGGASGSGRATVVIASEIKSILARIVAKDLAGNRTSTNPVQLTIPAPPKPADPEGDLKRAVAELPDLAALISAPEPVKPVGATPAKTGEIDVPAVGPEAPAATPAVPVAVAKPITELSGESAVPAKEPALPALAGKPVDSLPLKVAPGTPFLLDDEAQAALVAARELSKGDDRVAAQVAWLRLQESDVARAAVVEHLTWLRDLGLNPAIAGVGANLAPELLSDKARVLIGQALLDLNRPADAVGVLARINAKSPLARPATLGIARGLKAQKRTADADRILKQLAEGSDAVAEQAKADLAR